MIRATHRSLPLSVAAFLLASAHCAFAQAPPVGADFTGTWEHPRRGMVAQNPGDGTPGPVTGPAEHGDYTNPVLQPWAAAAVKKYTEDLEAGRRVNTSQQDCLPVGVPRVANIGPYSMQILQEKNLVTLLFEYDHQIRWVYLNEEHPGNVKTSWNGHSVGKWEGDTLVVDTIGQNDKTHIDTYGTPHTAAIHVVERFRLIDGGKTLEMRYTVTDQGAFTMPWTGVTRFTRKDITLIEHVCAENLRIE